MLIGSVSGDPSNVDLFGPGETIADWRLVPNDNNIGQRNVQLVPGGGGMEGLIPGAGERVRRWEHVRSPRDDAAQG